MFVFSKSNLKNMAWTLLYWYEDLIWSAEWSNWTSLTTHQAQVSHPRPTGGHIEKVLLTCRSSVRVFYCPTQGGGTKRGYITLICYLFLFSMIVLRWLCFVVNVLYLFRKNRAISVFLIDDQEFLVKASLFTVSLRQRNMESFSVCSLTLTLAW